MEEVQNGIFATFCDGLSEVELLEVKEQQVPIATMTVHWLQYHTNRESMILIYKLIQQLGESESDQQDPLIL